MRDHDNVELTLGILRTLLKWVIELGKACYLCGESAIAFSIPHLEMQVGKDFMHWSSELSYYRAL
jgi:hypothetical protein